MKTIASRLGSTALDEWEQEAKAFLRTVIYNTTSRTRWDVDIVPSTAYDTNGVCVTHVFVAYECKGILSCCIGPSLVFTVDPGNRVVGVAKRTLTYSLDASLNMAYNQSIQTVLQVADEIVAALGKVEEKDTTMQGKLRRAVRSITNSTKIEAQKVPQLVQNVRYVTKQSVTWYMYVPRGCCSGLRQAVGGVIPANTTLTYIGTKAGQRGYPNGKAHLFTDEYHTYTAHLTESQLMQVKKLGD